MHALVCLLPRTRQVSSAKCEQRPGLDDVLNSRAAHTSERRCSFPSTSTSGHVSARILLALLRRLPQSLCYLAKLTTHQDATQARHSRYVSIASLSVGLKCSLLLFVVHPDRPRAATDPFG